MKLGRTLGLQRGSVVRAALAAALSLASCRSAPQEPAPAATGQSAKAPAPSPSPAPLPGPAERSAWAGCGKPLPERLLWREQSEREVMDAISEAKACAARNQRKLLLEFVAPWCADCRAVTRLDQTEAVQRVMQARFERVRINVGEWDRHEALRRNYEVRALATYIVIDPETSTILARTTLEPITKPGRKLTASDWSAWLSRW